MGDQPDPPKSLADPPSVHGVGSATLGANRGRTHRVAKSSHYEDGTPENKQHRVSALPKTSMVGVFTAHLRIYRVKHPYRYNG